MGPSRPPMGRPTGRGGAARPPRPRVGGGEEEGEEGKDSESLRNSGFLFMWKIKRQELKAFLLVAHGEF